jgi:acetylornithine deacetylase/succinyl-diaminopimelate desuccinylase-like protein
MSSEALDLLQGLLRIDTTNPPGRERAAAEYLAESLRKDGIEPKLLEAAPERTSLVARLRGNGTKPPLLLTAHLDVVAAEPSRWKHPPFAAVVDDGWLYGRGAVDMKNMAAMSALVLKRLRREGVPLARDLIFAAVADEEAGCALGSQFLVDHHPDEVRAEYALGEIGGFTLDLNGKRLYPIQIAQKGVAWVRARVEGTPGHGSIPREDNPIVRLSAALAKLTPDALPLHPTPAVRRAIKAMAASQPLLARVVLPLILSPALARRVLAVLPDKGVARALNAILRNTATPTVLSAGTKTNVIPSFAEAEIDGRTLPGQRVEDFLAELSAVLGPDVKLDVIRRIEPLEFDPRTPFYAHLEEHLKQMDEDAVPVPYVIPGFTDAAPFSKLGTTYYGFSPIVLPPVPKVSFAELYHGDNERIPIDGFHRGLEALYATVKSWCT